MLDRQRASLSWRESLLLMAGSLASSSSRRGPSSVFTLSSRQLGFTVSLWRSFSRRKISMLKLHPKINAYLMARDTVLRIDNDSNSNVAPR